MVISVVVADRAMVVIAGIVNDKGEEIEKADEEEARDGTAEFSSLLEFALPEYPL